MSSRYYGQDYERQGRGSIDRWEDDDDRSRRRNRFREQDERSSRYGTGRDFSGSQREREFERDYGSGSSTPWIANTESSYGTNYNPGERYRNYDDDDYSERRQYSRTGSRGLSRRSHRPEFDTGYSPSYGTGVRGYGRSGVGYESERERGSRHHQRTWWDRITDEIASWFGDEDAERRRGMDEAFAGRSHRGKGPKSYRRSDERIREEVNDRLTDYDYLDASDIEVMVAESVVTLDGSVDNRWAKRIAEDIADTVSGVSEVQNNLRVRREQGTSAATRPSGVVPTETGTTGSRTQAKGA